MLTKMVSIFILGVFLLTRHEAREQAFVIIFEQVVSEKTTDEILTDALDARDFVVDKFAKRVAVGVEENAERINEAIASSIKGWNINRISKVCLAILKLSVFEILFEENLPVSVSINEAVELAKIYGGENDAPYVNGVLSTIEKKMEYNKNDN